MSEHSNFDTDDTGNMDDGASELHFEVMPLSPTPSRSSSGRAWRFLLPGIALLIALAILLTNFSPLRTSFIRQATTAPHATATATPEPTFALLGLVPDNCPPGNPVKKFSPSYGPGVGVADLPIWLVGFSGPEATMRFTGSVPLTARGWPSKLILAVGSDITMPIAISAKGMFGVTGDVWFSTGGVGQAATALIFDPQSTSPSADGTRGWPMNVYIPSAGCYFLNMRAGTTQTGFFFAAGR